MYALSKCLPFLRVATSGNGDDRSTTDKIEKLQPYTDDEEVALRFVQALCSSNKEERGVRAELHDIVNTSNFTESLAERILIGIIKVIQDGGEIGVAMRRAVTRSKEIALKFAQKYPFYTALMAAGTLIALGVLVIYAPVWVLEALGFAARGPRLGSFAARWMSQIARRYGNVSRGSIYAYLQSLGMTWSVYNID